jgi:hypothetical protein
MTRRSQLPSIDWPARTASGESGAAESYPATMFSALPPGWLWRTARFPGLAEEFDAEVADVAVGLNSESRA